MAQLLFAHLKYSLSSQYCSDQRYYCSSESRNQRNHNYFQNGCAALNFMVWIEAIHQIRQDVNLQGCSSFTCRMSRLAMHRPYRFFTNSLSLTKCVLYIHVVYFACLSRFPNVQAREVGVLITRIRAQPRIMFERGGIVKLLGADAFHEEISKAMGRLSREAQR